MKKKRKILIGIFLLAFIALYVTIYVLPNVAGALKRTTILEYGNLSIADEVVGFLVRDEQVYLADRSGEIQYYVGEGVKVRRGVRLLDIVGRGEPDEMPASKYNHLMERIGEGGLAVEINDAPGSGVISYYLDGYEQIFRPDTIKTLTKKEAMDLTGVVENVTRDPGVSVWKGEPLYKLFDNTQWFMLFWLDKESGAIRNYEQGKAVTVELPGGSAKGYVSEMLDQGEDWLVALSFDRYYQNLAQIRRVDAKVISADYQGLIVENSCLTTKDGTLGVYVKKKSGTIEFVPVNVKTSDGANSIISVSSFYDEAGNKVETVNVYEEVLRDPGGM